MPLPPVVPMPQPDSSGFAQINGISMYHAAYGPEVGTPVLLIHGGLCHADTWSSQVIDLMRDHRVIVADTRGHGRSSNDGTGQSYEQQTADYVALIQVLGIGPVDLVGWSDGAIIGLRMALSAPHLLRRLVAFGGNVTVDGLNTDGRPAPLIAEISSRLDADHLRMSPSPGACAQHKKDMMAMWSTELAGGVAALGRIELPVLVLHGAEEETIRLEHAQDIAAAIPGAELVVLPRVGHLALIQEPENFNAALRVFLDS